VAASARLNWGMTRFQAHSWGRWQDSVPPRLLGEPPAKWDSPQGSLLRQSKQMRSVREEYGNKIEVKVFCNLILEGIAISFDRFYPLEASLYF